MGQQRVIITNTNNHASYTKCKPNDHESFTINTIDPYLDTNIDLQFQPLNIKTTPMTIETNLKSQCMDGLVFLFNQCIHFTIYIITTTDNANSCRFEFRRTSGDAMVAAKFWSELKGLFER